ncbi:MAG TPA: MBL fold metallo-hydrolase [Dehalococcoidia bacterium]|nr:MBL fold metallo-hydrolase [Dehalococcoidia bacterium]
MGRLERRTVFADTMTARRDEDITKNAFMIAGFGNTTVVETGEGLGVIDVPARSSAKLVETIRARTLAPIHTIIYTHGHADHAFTTANLLEDASKRGYRRPTVVAHERVLNKFSRYKELGPYNWYINQIQAGRGFARPTGKEKMLPDDVVYPDITYRDSMSFKLGDVTFELYHYIGETDDGTWVWIPELKLVATGDLLEGDCPNIGNPFKIQRYEVEWAEALETIAGKNPDFLVPGHGPLRKGERISEWCLDTARYLRHFHTEIVRFLNEGYWIEDILDKVKPPEDLAGKGFLSPVYGCPAYVIHGVHRRYAGWYNGNPSELFPAKRADIASEITKLAGSKEVLARAKQLQETGKIQLALHMVDFIINGSKNKAQRKKALLIKSELLDARAEAEVNQIARNIFLVGSEEAEQLAKSL